MTSPGGIRIGVEADGSDFPRELEDIVDRAMARVQVIAERAFERVGASGTDAADQVQDGMRRASDASDRSLRDIADSATRAGDDVGNSMRRGGREAEEALNRVGNEAADSAQRASRETRQSTDQQADAYRSFTQRAQESLAGLGRASSEAGSTAASGLREGLGSQAGSTTAGAFVGKFSDGIASLASKSGPVAGTVLGVVGLFAGIGALIAAGIQDGLSNEISADKLRAQTGMSDEVVNKWGIAAGEAFGNAFGESVEANLGTVKQLFENGLIDASTTTDEVQRIIEKVQGLSDIAESETTETVRALDQLVGTGLVDSMDDAADLITVAMQRGANAGGDLLEVITEYSAGWKTAGFSGAFALGLVDQALDNNILNADYAGDAIREFGRRLTEEPELVAEAIGKMGLPVDELMAKLAEGGTAGEEAFDQVFDKIRSIEDPAARAAAIVGVLGDASGDFTAVFEKWDPSAAVAGLNDIAMASDDAIAIMGGNAGTSIQGAMNSLVVVSDQLKAGLAQAFGPQLQEWANGIANNRAGVMDFFIGIINMAFDGAEAVLRFTANGMRGLGEFAAAAANTGAGFLDLGANILSVAEAVPGFGALVGVTMGTSADDLRNLANTTRDMGDGISSTLNKGADVIEQRMIPQVENLQTRFNTFITPVRDVAAFNDSLAKTSGALEEVGLRIDGTKLNLEGFTGLLNMPQGDRSLLEGQILGVKDAMIEQIRVGAEAGATVETLSGKYGYQREVLIEQLEAMGLNTAEAQRLVDTFGLVPDFVNTQVNLPGMPQALSDLDLLRTKITSDNEKNVLITDNSDATLQALDRLNLKVLDGKIVPIDANDQAAWGKINELLKPQTKTITIQQFVQPPVGPGLPKSTGESYNPIGGGFANMHGSMMLERFANGGTRLPSTAVIKPETDSLVQWAERGTGGEAFIPLASSKRGRSMQILEETAHMFGYGLTKMADGGIRGGAAVGTDSGGLLVDVLTRLAGALEASPSLTPTGAAPIALGEPQPLLPDLAGALPSVDALGEGLTAAKDGVIDPALTGMHANVDALGQAFPIANNEVIQPALGALGAGLLATKDGIVDPALWGIQGNVAWTGQMTADTVNGVVLPSWNNMGVGIQAVKAGSIDPAFAGIQGGLLNVQGAFANGVGAISTQWDQMRGAVGRPVRFAIDTVFNNGLVGMWNSVSDLIGTKKMAPYLVGGFAKGTDVLPGYSPGTDNMKFVSQDGSTAINLSGGEGIARPEVVAAVGTTAWNEMNAAAVKGGKNGVNRYLGGFAGGGVVGAMTNIVKQKYPMIQMTSGLRSGDNGMHGRGLAGDFSNGSGNTPAQLALARDIGATYPGSAELIYDSPGWSGNLKNGRNVGPFGQFYTMAQAGNHKHHVHWGMTVPPTVPFGGTPFAGGSDGGGGGSEPAFDIGAAVNSTLNGQRKKITDSLAGFRADGIMGSLPQKTYDSMNAAMQTKIDAGIAAAQASGAVSMGTSASMMEHARAIVDSAKARGMGREGGLIGLMTGLAESGIRILANPAVPESFSFPHDGVGNDHDSTGIFQQRQAGWGTLAQRMNARGSADLFFNKLGTFNWRGMDPGAAAQRVQVSAYPDAYNRYLGQATGILDSVFDAGGVANGRGLMLKDVIRPERTLSPEQTVAFERLLPLLQNLTATGSGELNIGGLTLRGGGRLEIKDGIINAEGQATVTDGKRTVLVTQYISGTDARATADETSKRLLSLLP